MAHPEGQNRQRAAGAVDLEWGKRFRQHMRRQDGRIIAVGWRLEDVAEFALQTVQGELIRPQVDLPALRRQHQNAQIIHAMRLVGMIMRDQHTIQPADFCRQQLFAQIG